MLARLADAAPQHRLTLISSAPTGATGGNSGHALRLVRERATVLALAHQPSFPGREVRRVQAEILTEIKSDQDDPRTVAARRFRKEIYQKHPLGRPPR